MEWSLSRSSFHERFVLMIGLPPMQYLTQWRMQVASDCSARRVRSCSRWRWTSGTRARAAFSRAFKRVAGNDPRSVEKGQGSQRLTAPAAPRRAHGPTQTSALHGSP